MGQIIIPWPPQALWPNRNGHWAKTVKPRRNARHWAAAACLEARVHYAPAGRLVFSLHPPRKPGLMNIDNCIAALKPTIDGMAAFWGVDDSTLRIVWPETFSEPVKGGRVVVEVTA